ncbi:ATP-binding protein [Halioxenophilus aromaticivorans]|uniref:SbcC/MukB-like Walker B domain-containing protein n=1 Tax=Halioxenophilus aromaticivorans TaxID=1306992 RepID=A0AAV3U860_9ALTE
MYLKRSITVNWGNLPAQELEYGPVNLFSGGNGSGKTTAADALQTLMTAAFDNLFNFNPGQDETTQKGRGGKQVRTLASYVLGCDDGAFSRPWDTDGYIAGVFHPTKGETAEAFTAVIGVRAHLDRAGSSNQARQDELLLMIVPDEMLSLSHFVRDYPDGKHTTPITELPKLLRKEFGKQSVETYDKKGAYLARLYGALRGKRDAVSQQDAKNAARTFARFMAYKPVESIDQFVASEVLEAHDMGDTIRRIRDLLRTVHGMEQEANQLRQGVQLLEQAKLQANDYLDKWLERTALSYGAASQQYQLNQKQYLTEKDNQKTLNQGLRAVEEQKAQLDLRVEQSHQKLVSLEAKIQGIPALRNKHEMEQKKESLSNQLTEGVGPLLAQDQQRNTNLDALRNIQSLLSRYSIELELKEFSSNAWRQTSKELQALDASELPDVNQVFGRDWIDLSPLEAGQSRVHKEEQLHNRLADLLHDAEQQLTGEATDSLNRKLDRLVDDRANTLKGLEQQERLIQQRITNLEANQVNYPRYVEDAVQAIRNECPQADPRVLCDHVEILDSDWQMAIEGYIGGARFGILVEEDYEAEAISIVRRLKVKQRNSARVIQGNKAKQDAAQQSLPADSIFHAMRFSHRTAEHYLKASYGSVVQVDDAEQLRKTRRGITAEGMGSGNYALFRCDLADSQLVFGEAARERNLQAQRQSLQDAVQQLTTANDAYQSVQQLSAQAARFKPLAWSTCFSGLLDTQRQLEAIENEIANLDLSDHQALEQQRDEIQAQFNNLDSERRALDTESGKLDEQLRSCNQSIDKLANRRDQLLEDKDNAEAYLLATTQYWPGLDVMPCIQAMDDQLLQVHSEIDFSAQEEFLTKCLNKACVELQKVLEHYNQQAQPADQLMADSAEDLHSAGFFGHVRQLQQQVDSLYNRLNNNVLLAKQEQLASLRDSFNTTFVSDLCNEIHQAIRDGERLLESLNQELQHHRFGADREYFTFEWEWLPEFKEYWDFFREVIDIPNLGDGASLFDSTLSKDAVQIRDRLLSLLLDGDEQQALRELERISDYRRYRRYDILKHPANKAPIRLSQYGTGSGGQLETPAYIIRAAAITSAFRFNEGDSHLRMVIVDEAFMHMDETRSREVIGYLTETLGLQLIFIMPTSKAGPFLDLISNQFVFAKVPSPTPVGELNTRVLVDRQQLNKERIRELWAQHRRVIRQQGTLDFMEEI